MAKLSAEQIRNRFGFSYNENHAANSGGYSKYGGRDDGAIYSTTDGTYIGTINNFTPRDGNRDAKGISQYKAVQDYELSKGYRGNARTDWDSMNDVAGAVNSIFGKGKAPQAAPERRKPIQLSDRAAEAKAYTGAYEEVMLPRQGDYIIKNDQSVVNDFDTEYDLQLKQAKQPYMADGSDVPNSVQAEATEYANDYKKAVADTLVPQISF